MPENGSTEKSESTFRELRTINRIIDKICRAPETNHIMSIIIEELVDFTGAVQGVINLLTPSHETDFVTVIRDKQSDSAKIPYRVSNLVSGWVLRHKTVLKVDDLDSDTRFAMSSSEDGQFKSLLCCPMIARGEVIGLTSLVRDESAGPFDDDHARLAGIVASQSAQVLKNTLLLEELARKNELLEVSRQQLADENARLKIEIDASSAFENIVGKSEAIKKVLVLASRVSVNDSPVMITGPTGTGKELIARAIHNHSRRKNKPFVVKNCGVKTESLLESELFGHIRGAFTGADRSKPGLFREADEGTIFLDEIGDAPLSTQVAILRVLENGEIRPVGSSKDEVVDVRIISATNKDLEELIEKGEFRQDLFYRLNTLTIAMPPLSQRLEDIPLLVHNCMEKLKIKLGLENLTVTPAAMDALCNYSWPGNVRQLEHEIERAAVVCETDGTIDISDISPGVLGSIEVDPETSSYRGRLRDIVEKVESDIIIAALRENKGNILKTSRVLGLTRKGLKDKIARYGINSDHS